MANSSVKGLHRKGLVALLIAAILIVVFSILWDYPLLRTPDNLNIFFTSALFFFAIVETLSTISQARIEKKRKRTLDLREELEKLYGPVYSVLNNGVYRELRKLIFTQSEKKLMDETFSQKPFVLTSQTEWKDKIRNREIRKSADFDIPINITDRFCNEYEAKKGEEAIEKQFHGIYHMFKNAPQEVEEVYILLPDDKTLVDKKFSNYPYMLSQELYNCWKKEIRFLKITIAWEAFEDRITLLENLKLGTDSTQNGPTVYRVPKTFVTKFLEEYDTRVHEYNKL